MHYQIQVPNAHPAGIARIFRLMTANLPVQLKLSIRPALSRR